MARTGYKTLQEIAVELGVHPNKLRTIVARLDIQPIRFADDRRKLYYNLSQIEQIKKVLGFS